MGKLYDSQGNRKGSWSYKQGIETQESDLEKLLGIAQDADVEPPKDKPGLLNRILGALRASETSGIAHDVQQGEGLGSALKNYGRRIGKGWTLQGLDEEDLGVPGYKEILEERGVSSKPWFEAGPLKPSTAGTLGLAGDIFLDPLTYVGGIGALTKTGKAASKRAAQQAAEEVAGKGVRTIAPDIATKKLGRTWGEQALKGQRSLLSFMGQPVVPKKVSAKAFQTVDDLIRKSSGTRLGKVAEATRNLFDDTAVPFARKGIPELEDQWKKRNLIETLSKNTGRAIEEKGTKQLKELYESLVEETGGRKYLGKGSPKNQEKIEPLMEKVLHAYETRDIPDRLRPFVEKMDEVYDTMEPIWMEHGGKVINDPNVKYWPRALKEDLAEGASKYGGARKFKTKTASDLKREYVKVIGEDGKKHIGHIDEIMKKLNLTKGEEGLRRLFRERDSVEKMYGRKINSLENEISNIGERQMERFLKEGKTKGEALLKQREGKILNNIKKIEDRISYIKENTLQGKRWGMTKEQAEQAATNKLFKTLRKERVTGDEDILKKLADIKGASPKSETFKVTDEMRDRLAKELEDLEIQKQVELLELDAIRKGGVRKLTPKQAIGADEVVTKGAKGARSKIETRDGLINYFKALKDQRIKEIDETLEKVDPYDVDNKLFGNAVQFKEGDVAVPTRLKTNVYDIKQATKREVDKASGGKLFTDNIAKTGYLMTARTGQKAAGDTYFRMISKLGVPADQAPEGFVKAFGDNVKFDSELVSSTAKELKDSGLLFPKDVAEAIDKTYKAYFTDEAVNEVLKLYDDLLSGFKSSVTGLWPGFQTRNAISNLWQNYLGGVWKPKHYNESRQILQDLKLGKTLTKKQQKMWDEYVEQGLKGFGWFGGDAERKVSPELTSETPGFLSIVNQAGLNVGGDIEDFGKLTHYIAKREMGYSPLDAAMEVKKYLFDYSDLTDFEQNVMKRIFPFYSFTRKNVPMELQTLIQDPSKFSNVAKVTRGSVGEEEDLPEWMQDKGKVKIGEEDGLQKFLTGGWTDTPMTQPLDLIGEDIPSTIKKTGGSLLSPFIKLPLELAFDENMFFGEPISEVDNVPDVWGKDLNDTALGDALGIVETDYGYRTSKPELWHIIRSVGTRPFSSLETGAKLSEEDKSRLKQILYLLTGTRVREVDPQQTQYYKKKDQVESLKDFLEGQGAIYRGEYFGESK